MSVVGGDAETRPRPNSRSSALISAMAIAGLVGGCPDDAPVPADTEASTTGGPAGPTTTDAATSPTVTPQTTEGTASTDGASSTDDGATASSTSAGSESTTAEAPLDCPQGTLMIAPSTLQTSTVGETDAFTGSCGGAGSPDFALLYQAPFDGTYVIDTAGSVGDTVLYVLAEECGGAELACSDDDPLLAPDARVQVQLTAEQTITIVIDGVGPMGWPVQLHVEPLEGICPDGDLGMVVPVTVVGDTTTADNTAVASCATSREGPDDTWQLTAPQAATYVIDTLGSSFDTVLHVRDGSGCDGIELACNDDAPGLIDGPSAVMLDLAAGQTVTVVVDGQPSQGDYALSVEVVGGSCPDFDIGGAVPQTFSGDLGTADNTTAGSCGGTIAGDDAYRFTAPGDGLFVFSTVGSATDTVLHARDGSDCLGPELACNDDLSMMTDASRLALPLSAGQSIVVVVDGNDEGPYQLGVTEDVCPDTDLGAGLPLTVPGSTLGLTDTGAASCGGAGAPDFAMQWQAPADDMYVIDTLGSSYDTVLYVLDGSGCFGPELACNDDFGLSLQSQVAVPLTAGQVVTLVVDGFDVLAGNFVLHIGI